MACQDMFKKVQETSNPKFTNHYMMVKMVKSEAPLLGKSKSSAQVALVQTGHETGLEDIKEERKR